MAAPSTLRLVDPTPQHEPLGGTTIALPDDDIHVDFSDDGAMRVVHPDGSATIDFNPDRAAGNVDSDDFYRNLANEIDEGKLTSIADELLTGINYDEDSRKDWLQTRARGIQLLGLKLEEPRGDVSTTSAPIEGQSTIRHPLLLEATVRFQATARGELLPATGPVKVRNDATPPPESQQPPYTMQPQEPPSGQQLDDLGDALETDMNHYLTVTATEYYPDTDRMLFHIGYGGDGFKKVYSCPLRRRPVSESVDAEDLIVSNTTTDLRNCGRITHKIKMRPSTLRRMQIVGAYRDVKLTPPNVISPFQINEVDKEKANIEGRRPSVQQPKDADYGIYECYTELELDEFAPEQFKGKGLPLPFVVTIEKESRQVLQVRRNWDQDDDQCMAKQFFVQFPFIRGLGFYGLGLIHILGNVAMTLTAIWREFIDSGMFANFPGLLGAKGAGRQLTNQIRVPPGGIQLLDVPPGLKIQDAVMPLPYKEPGPAFTAFVQHVEEVGMRLGQTAEVQIGEGKQEVPVGTTMAMIEQATKVIDSVHKRLHAAQAEEFGLLKERFKEDPEAFWRHNKKPARQWEIDEFMQALDQRELVPVADPNNPTSLHRIAKSVALLTLASQYQQLFNPGAVLKRVLRIVGIDAEGLLNTAPTPPPPDPRFAAIQAKSQAEQAKNQIEQFQSFLKMQEMQLKMRDSAEDRASREKLHAMQLQLEAMRIREEQIIHAHDLRRDDAQAGADMANKRMAAVHDTHMNQAQHQQDLLMDAQKHTMQMRADQAKTAREMMVDHARSQQQMEVERTRHAGQMERDRAKHEQATRHADEKHKADLEHKRALARVAARAKPKPAGGK